MELFKTRKVVSFELLPRCFRCDKPIFLTYCASGKLAYFHIGSNSRLCKMIETYDQLLELATIRTTQDVFDLWKDAERALGPLSYNKLIET